MGLVINQMKYFIVFFIFLLFLCPFSHAFPEMEVIDFQISELAGNNNGVIEAGEDVSVRFSLYNGGDEYATAVVISVSTGYSEVVIEQSNVLFPPVAPESIVNNREPSLVLNIGDGAVCGDEINLKLTISSDQGQWVDEVVVPLFSSNISHEAVNYRISTDGLTGEFPLYSPAMAIDDGGDVYVVREEARGGSFDIYFSFSPDYGVSWREALKIDSGDSGSTSFSTSPVVDCDDKGNVCVVWQDWRNYRSDLFCNFSSDYGESWLAEDIEIDGKLSGMTGNSYNQQVLLDKTGLVHVFWEDSRNGRRDIYYNSSADGGLSWRGVQRLDRGDLPGEYESTALKCASDGKGRLLAVWHDYRNGRTDIYANYSDDGGMNWATGDIRIDRGDGEGASYSYNPFPLVSKKGRFFVAWDDQRSGKKNIMLNYSDNGRDWLSDSLVLDSGAKDSVSVKLAENNSSVLTALWQDNRSGDYDIYVNSFDEDGSALYDDIKVNVSAVSLWRTYYEPQLGLDRRGNIFVCWKDYKDDNPYKYDIFLNFSTNGGLSWQPFDLKVNEKDFVGSMGLSYPVLKTDSKGYSSIIWLGSRRLDENFSLYYDSFSPQCGPQADFAVKRLSCSSYSWFFENRSYGGILPLQMLWSFGDGSESSSYSPTHIFSEAGSFDVTLAVTDGRGDFSSSMQTLVVSPLLRASFQCETQLYEGDAVNFINSSSGGEEPVQYLWSFGDGTYSVDKNPVHYYRSSGMYMAELTVTDRSGCSVSSDEIIRIWPGQILELDNIVVSDFSGDGNGKITADENLSVGMVLTNNGMAGATTPVISLLPGDGYSLVRASQTFPDVPAGSSVSLDEPFLELVVDSDFYSCGDTVRIDYILDFAEGQKEGFFEICLDWNKIEATVPEYVWESDSISAYSASAVSGDSFAVSWDELSGTVRKVMVRTGTVGDSVMLESPTTISNPDFDAFNPVLLGTDNGYVYVCWLDERNGKAQVYFRASYNGGADWTEEIRLSSETLPGVYLSYGHSMAANSEGGVYCAWSEERNGKPDIYVSSSGDFGRTWTVPARIDRENLPGFSSSGHVKLACNDSSTVYALWESDRDGERDIYFNRSLDGGRSWLFNPVRIDTMNASGTTTSMNCVLKCNGTSEVMAVWQDYVNGEADIYFSSSSDSGSGWTAPVRLDSGDFPGSSASISPVMEVNEKEVAVVWYDLQNGEADIYLSRKNPEALVWSEPVRIDLLDNDGEHSSFSPALAFGKEGDIFSVWSDLVSGKADIFLSAFGRNAVPVRLDIMDEPGQESSVNPLIFSLDNSQLVIWLESKGLVFAGTDKSCYLLCDINCDGIVDGQDLVILSRSFGSVVGDDWFFFDADFNYDQCVDGDDLSIFASNYGNHQ